MKTPQYQKNIKLQAEINDLESAGYRVIKEIIQETRDPKESIRQIKVLIKRVEKKTQELKEK